MAILRTEALLLRAVDYGESDLVVHLLTPEAGRLAAIAKGARRSRRRFPGTLDLLNHLRVTAERRRPGTLARLDHAALLRTFETTRASPRRFALACYLVELVSRLAPEGGARADSERLFDFALGALRAVEAREPDPRLRVLLELRALDALGLRPELRRCVRCGAPALAPPAPGRGPAAPVGYHVGEGGPVCGGCAAAHEALLPVHAGTLRALEQSLGFGMERLDRLALAGAALEEAHTLVGRFLRFHVGLELRSEPFLERSLAVRTGAASAD